MARQSARGADPHACHGEVVIYRLSGGPAIKETITDRAPAGIGLTTEKNLTAGEIVRLLFPRRGREENRCGRMNIGRVTHFRAPHGNQRIKFAFACDAAVKGAKRVLHQATPRPRWFRFFSPRAISAQSAESHR
jgi:hypothetical protein